MKVKFLLKKVPGTGRIQYPDDKKFFRDTEIIGEYIIAEYSGKMTLSLYEDDPYFLHISMTEGDGMAPIGMLNDGIDTISVVGTFRTGSDPDSQALPIGTALEPFIIRVNIRDDQDKIRDIVKASFVDGSFSMNYKTTGNPGVFHIDQMDMTKLIYTTPVKLIGDLKFKIYRDLEAE